MSNNPIKKPRLFVPIFKLTIVPLLLAYLIFDFIKQSSLTTLNLNIWIIVAALIVNQIGLMLFAIRMHLILHIFNINISYFQSLRIHLQSMFYFFVLPMTVGMEAARYVKINNIEGV